MTIEQWRKEQEDEDFGFRLASLSPRRTGLPAVVWIEVGSGENIQPRMLFTNYSFDGLRSDSLVPISLDPENPEILVDNFTLHITTSEVEAIKQWITHKYPILLAHWNGEIDSCEAIQQLTP